MKPLVSFNSYFPRIPIGREAAFNVRQFYWIAKPTARILAGQPNQNPSALTIANLEQALNELFEHLEPRFETGIFDNHRLAGLA